MINRISKIYIFEPQFKVDDLLEKSGGFNHLFVKMKWIFPLFFFLSIILNSNDTYGQFPVVAGTNVSAETDNVSSHNIALPSGIQSGDLLLIFWADRDVNTTVTIPAGWTVLYNDNTSNYRKLSMYRIANGAEGNSLSVTTSDAERSAHNSYRISVDTYTGIPVAGTITTGTNANPNPPNLTSGFGNVSTLWIASAHAASNSTYTVIPTNYSNLIEVKTGTAQGNDQRYATVGTTRRTTSSGTENPDNFTISQGSQIWGANTIAIRGAAVGPTITTGTLTGFGNICINTNTSANSFTISGSNLNASPNISVQALSGFTYSTSSNGTYTSTLNLGSHSGTYNTTVYVKFNPTLVQSYNGNIAVGGGGTTSPVNVVATGTGINTPPSIDTPASGTITSNSAIIGGNITDAGCSTISERGIYYSTTNGFANGAGTKVTASGTGTGVFTTTVSGLLPFTTYYYKAYATNNGGSVYTTQGSFTTLGPVITVGAISDFGYQAVNTTSSEQSYSVTGTYLTDPIIIIPPAGFEISTTSGVGYSSTQLTLTPTSGNVNQTIFVVFHPSVIQDYSGDITHTSTGAAEQDVNVTGTSVISYCNAFFSDASYEWISNVTFADINNNSNGNSGEQMDYTNFVAEVEQGSVYPLSVTINADYSDYIYAFIDWNQSGNLDDADEVYTIGSNTSSDGPHTINVNVPLGAKLGNTRMRVMVDWNHSTPDPCRNATFGEAEDYTVNVINNNTLQISTTPTNNDCNGENNGAITATGSGGETPYQFKLDAGAYQSSGNFTGMAANTYTVWIKDNLGTEVSTTETITEPEILAATISSVSPACGGSDGSITIAGSSGGSGSYEYSVSGGLGWQTSANFSGLSGGSYNILIRDAAVSGCSEVLNSNYNLTESGSTIPLIAETNTVDCSSSANGAIDLKVPYPIQFNDPDFIDVQSTLLSNRATFTLEGWIKVDLATVGSRISLFGQNDAIEMGFSNNNTLMCWTASGGSVSTGVYPSDSEWHHVATVGNGTNLFLYIDGNFVATGGNTTGNYGNNTAFTSKIGAGVWDPTGGVFPGQMIKVGFWSSALSASEISNLASSYYHYTGFESGLMAGFNFYEGSGLVLGSEISGTDGAFNGTPTWLDNYSFSWTKNGTPGFSENTEDLTGLAPGTFNISVTNSEVGCSNSDSWTINILDNELPSVTTCPSNITVSTDAGICEALVNYSLPVFNDNCDGSGLSGTRSAGLASGSLFPLGETTVTYEYTDLAGNGPIDCSFTVTVYDNEKPEITCPGGINTNSDIGLCTATGVNLGTPSTSDNCGIFSVSNNASEPYNLGNTTITWTVTDNSGNTETCQQIVTVNDNENPKITCPGEVISFVDAGTCEATGVSLGTPVVMDNCSVASVVNNGSEPYTLGINTITWTVSDVSGNTATCFQTVTVVPEDTIDIQVVDFSDDCQSGETGTTTITWDISKTGGTSNWTYDYTIKEGLTTIASGTNTTATGNTQVSYIVTNEAGSIKSYTINITNVTDDCGIAETVTTNNSDNVTLTGVPETSEIFSN